MAAAVIAPPIENDEELQRLYNWVDEVPLSRPKRNISRDFSDGVLYAEIVHHFYPKMVELHNYSAANSNDKKIYNWNTLNMKVLRKQPLGYQIHQQDIEDVIKASPGAIERLLGVLRDRVLRALSAAQKPGSRHSGQGGRASSGAPPEARGYDEANPYRHPPPLSGAAVQRYQEEVDTELLVEKEQAIAELREMVGIMSEKITKLEQLVRIKDAKIEALSAKLEKHGLR